MFDIIVSVLAVAVGAALIFLALGELILRLLVALFGLWLINYGFKVRGQSLYTRVYKWSLFRRF
jgi:hypothetical protein